MTNISEEAIIRKLVADGDGTSEDKRIVQLFSLIGMLANSPATDPKAVSTKILNTLDQIELCVKKQCLISDVHEQETKSNEELFVDIDHMLDKNTERMEQVKEELANAKLVRKNRQEYDLLAKLIKEKPSRRETIETLKKLQTQLDEDQERQQQLEQKLVERRKNMYSLAILLNNLEEEETVDAAPAAVSDIQHASDEGEAME